MNACIEHTMIIVEYRLFTPTETVLSNNEARGHATLTRYRSDIDPTSWFYARVNISWIPYIYRDSFIFLHVNFVLRVYSVFYGYNTISHYSEVVYYTTRLPCISFFHPFRSSVSPDACICVRVRIGIYFCVLSFCFRFRFLAHGLINHDHSSELFFPFFLRVLSVVSMPKERIIERGSECIGS